MLKKQMIKVFAICLSTCMIIAQHKPACAQEETANEISKNEAYQCIEKFITTINEKNWNEYIDLRLNSDRKAYREYFNDNNAEYGVKMLNSVSIKKAYNIDYCADNFMYKDEYKIENTLTDYHAYLLALDCSVNISDSFFSNGLNYYYILVSNINDEARIVQFSKAPTQMVKEYVYNLTESDQIKVNQLIQNENDFLKNTFKNKINSLIQVQSDWANSSNFYWSYGRPSTIRVKGYGSVSFKSYIKNVLPNEVYTSWKREALKANALAIEMVGIYHVRVNPVAESWDVTTATQKYIPNTSNATCNEICDLMYDIGMASDKHRIFFPSYKAGTSSSLGTAHSGEMKQWGSQNLAKNGKKYKEILRYYYSYSNKSKGDIEFFRWNC